MSTVGNTTSLELAHTPSQKGLIPDDFTQVVEKLSVYLSIYLGTQSVILNCINIIVFLKLGIKDCVSICLFLLSITDGAFLFFTAVGAVSGLLETMQIYLYLQYQVVYALSITLSAIAYDASSYTIAFISLERCLCVALPFRFKDLFTFTRALVTIICIYIFTFASYFPHFITTEFRLLWDARTNSTRLFIWYTENTLAVSAFLNVLNQLVLGSISLLIVIVSTYVMVRGLHKSSQFQKKGTANASTTSPTHGARRLNSDEHVIDNKNKDTRAKDQETSQRNDTKKSGQMSNKNRLVVKMVSTLATIYLACNISRLFIVVILRIEPELMLGRRYQNMYALLVFITYIFHVINTSCNTFVYLKLNPSYKNMFLKILGVKLTKQT